MIYSGGRAARWLGLVTLSFGVAVACSSGDGDSTGEATRFFGGDQGAAGTGGSAGDASVTCNGTTCPPPPTAAAGLAEPCCQTNDSCGFKIPSLGQECYPPADADATTTDPDCPDVTWQGEALPGCCLPDGKTCGAVGSMVGTGCLDAALFGVTPTVDCNGDPVGTGGTGGGGTGGGGTGGGGTGGGGTGGGGTGGGGTGGTGGTGGCETCSYAASPPGNPANICAGAEKTKWDSLKVCCGCGGEVSCAVACWQTLCSDKPFGGTDGCLGSLSTQCSAQLNACIPPA